MQPSLLVLAIFEFALFRQFIDVDKRPRQVCAFQTEFAHSRRIDDAAARRNEEQFPVCGRVPAFVISSDFPRLNQLFPKDSVDQGRFAYAG